MKYFIIKGGYKIKNFKELNKKAHIGIEGSLNNKGEMVNVNKTLKIRESFHSNTFMVYKNGRYYPVSGVYETVGLSYKDVVEVLHESELRDVSYVEMTGMITREEAENLVRVDRSVIMKECCERSLDINNVNTAVINTIENTIGNKICTIENKICTIENTVNRDNQICAIDTIENTIENKICAIDNMENKIFLSKILNSEIIKIIRYLQSLENKSEFSIYNESIKNWALKNFRGVSEEIGYYLLVESIKKKEESEFFRRWRASDLEEIDVGRLELYVSNESKVGDGEKREMMRVLREY